MSESIVDLTDDAAILPVLERDRRWAAYALCDLEPPYRPHARYIGAVRDGRADAVVLVYSVPSFTSLLPCGDSAAIAAIMAGAEGLPASVYLLVRRGDLAAVETRYRVERAWTMWRMAVDAESLRPSPPVDAAIVALSRADLAALQGLYAQWPASVFTPSMLDPGIYYGAYRGGELVAVAGTHAIARRHRIGVIGNVFTHPAHRGHGLASAVTGAVTQALLQSGAQEVALNVAEDNAAAIATYRRLGFTLHEPFWEGHATLRQSR